MSDALLNQLSHLPNRLAWHILLTMSALACGIAISLPLAILATRVRALRGPLVGAASVIQTIPSLAILALMVPLLGQIGFLPAFIALLLYGILPILRNAVTGLDQVDENVIEAACGVGMSPGQILRRVQFPLALPIIIAGVRTSAVWLVGIATLSTPVGQTSLGDYIFQGLQLRNNTAVITGCIAAALLAIILDGLIRLMEIGASGRQRRWMVVSAAGLILLGCVGVTPFFKATADVQVGAKTFTEQFILAEAVRNHLNDAGLSAKATRGMGSTILFESLSNNSLDVYVDYTGTLWSNVLKRDDIAGAEKTYKEVSKFLQDEYGILTLGRLGFENAYALGIRRETAEKYSIKTIGDLALHAPKMKIAGDYEFFARPEWKNVESNYGLRFSEILSMDAALMYTALRDGQVDVVSVFSTDGRIAAYDLVVLEDPRNALPPYDAVLLLSPEAAGRPEIIEALRPMIGAYTDKRMRMLNKAVDLDGKEVIDAAKMD